MSQAVDSVPRAVARAVAVTLPLMKAYQNVSKGGAVRVICSPFLYLILKLKPAL